MGTKGPGVVPEGLLSKLCLLCQQFVLERRICMWSVEKRVVSRVLFMLTLGNVA